MSSGVSLSISRRLVPATTTIKSSCSSRFVTRRPCTPPLAICKSTRVPRPSTMSNRWIVGMLEFKSSSNGRIRMIHPLHSRYSTMASSLSCSTFSERQVLPRQSLGLSMNHRHWNDEQRRGYFYPPASWEEFKERWNRSVEASEERTIRVQLLKQTAARHHQAMTNTLSEPKLVEPNATTTSNRKVFLFSSSSLSSAQRRKHPMTIRDSMAYNSKPRRSFRKRIRQFLQTTKRRRNLLQQQQLQVFQTIPYYRRYVRDKTERIYALAKTPSERLLWRQQRKQQWNDWVQQRLQRPKAAWKTVWERIQKNQQLQQRMGQWWSTRTQPRILAGAGVSNTNSISNYNSFRSTFQSRYQGWKMRRKEQFQRLFLVVQETPITITEYSKPEWFDSLGRPLTSRDSTGRFVNPWQSQSTNGVHSLDLILAWRWLRLKRTISRFGYFSSLIPRLSWNTTNRITTTNDTTADTTNETSSGDDASNSNLQNVSTVRIPHPNPSNIQLTWIGHATCYVQMGGFTILFDPMFSLRASPYQSLPIGVPRDVLPSHSITQLIQHIRDNNSNASNTGSLETPALSSTSETRSDNSNDASRSPTRTSSTMISSNTTKIDICCITHDHYDHLDKNSVLELKHCVQLWVIPLGIKQWLVEKCSIDPSNIIELEWWEQVHLAKPDVSTVRPTQQTETTVSSDTESNPKTACQDGTTTTTTSSTTLNATNTNTLTITCCPASHWSSRTVFDRNLRLWGSFALESSSSSDNSVGANPIDRDTASTTTDVSPAPTTSTATGRFFFCGDTGLPSTFPLFQQIGDFVGPFDLAALPIGAYEPRYINKLAHVNPKEAIEIHRQIRSKQSIGIHWGTFALTEEGVWDPPRQLQQALEQSRMEWTSSSSSTSSNVIGRNNNDDNDNIGKTESTKVTDKLSVTMTNASSGISSVVTEEFVALPHGSTIEVPVGSSAPATATLGTLAEDAFVTMEPLEQAQYYFHGIKTSQGTNNDDDEEEDDASYTSSNSSSPSSR